MSIKKYLLPLLIGIGLAIGGVATALVTLPPSVQKGDLIVATSTSQLVRLATGTQGSVLQVNNGVPAWTGVSSQWTTLDSDIYYNTGKVGIGTTTVGSRLVIQGSTSDNSASALNILDSLGNSKVYVRNDGNIGIGTTTVGSTLTIQTGVQAGLLLERPNGLTNIRIDAIGGSSQIQFGNGGTLGATSSWTIGRYNTDNSFRFATSDNTGTTDKMAILQNGNVGIGTTTPSQLLTVGNNNQFTVTSAGAVNTASTINSNSTITGSNLVGSAAVYTQTFSGISDNGYISIQNNRNFTNPGTIVKIQPLTASNSTGGINIFAITPTYTQSGSASSTDFLINRTETSVGTGTQRLFDAQVGGVSKFMIDSAGNVGIGTTSPSSRLYLQNSGGTTNVFNIASSSNAVMDEFDFQGHLGIGTTTDTSNLAVQGQSGQTYNLVNVSSSSGASMFSVSPAGVIQQNSQKSCTLGLTTDASGNINGCVASDQRLKKNIIEMAFDPNALMAINPVQYKWLPIANRDSQTHIGFIAQDVQKSLPKAVSQSGNYLGVDSNAMIAYLWKFMQTFNKQFTDFMHSTVTRMNSQDAKIKAMQAQIDHQQLQINMLLKEAQRR